MTKFFVHLCVDLAIEAEDEEEANRTAKEFSVSLDELNVPYATVDEVERYKAKVYGS